MVNEKKELVKLSIQLQIRNEVSIELSKKNAELETANRVMILYLREKYFTHDNNLIIRMNVKIMLNPRTRSF